jgi:steroid delta-isomerase-like uncharacterized protein
LLITVIGLKFFQGKERGARGQPSRKEIQMKEQQPEVLREEFVRDFIKRWEEAWNARDVDRIVSLYTDDFVFVDPAVPEGTLHGREAVKEFLTGLFRALPDAHWEWVCEPYVTLDGTRAAGRWRLTATMLGPLDPPGFAPTGGRVEFEGIDFYDEFKEGLVSHYTVLFDMLDFGRQIGAAPKPGTFSDRMGMFMQRMAARRMKSRRAR